MACGSLRVEVDALVDPLHITHLCLVAAWGGIVATESVMELAARLPVARRHVAELHYWIDLLVELPVIAGVLVTGGVLLWRSWPPSTILVIKVALALVAIGANLWCIAIVVWRRRHADDEAALGRGARLVRLTAGLGIPFGLAAAWLGLAFFRG